MPISGKLDGLHVERGGVGLDNSLNDDLQSVYKLACESLPRDVTVILQNTQHLKGIDSLFYTPVVINECETVSGMLDTGSMACSINEVVEQRLIAAGILDPAENQEIDIVLVGCGGQRAHPKRICDLRLEVYGCAVVVPTLVVPGQVDELIIGTNVIKYLTHKFKESDKYWKMISENNAFNPDDQDNFLCMLAGIQRWQGEEIPDIVGTVKLNHSVTLLPGHEHLVWGKLPEKSRGIPGCTVVVEPTKSRSIPRNILVGRVITPLWGDGWVPMKIVNPTEKMITLRRNAKLADVSPCLAVEELQISNTSSVQSNCQITSDHLPKTKYSATALKDVGLNELDLDSCEVSDHYRNEMCNLVIKYADIFSKHKLDCGEVKDFVHKIHLVDERPFKLPYRRVPPAHYQKLRETLNEMEEKGIIRKSTSEFASPLVLVWKKNGDLRICTDFRWLNARTVKDAYPLPHQADCLAALGGNVLFSTMDLTSGFYNVPLHEDHKKFTAFASPVGLHEYNRLPQGLCNSPASFMRMMMMIFGDQNFLSLLCYLDDLMVFAPSEDEALKRLEMVFERLRTYNLKLAPKKCHFLRRSVHFLGHVIDSNGVATDPEKVDAISKVTKSDLMSPDGLTPCPKKIKSFLGLVMWYQRFIPNCSTVAKPLFQLTAEGKINKTRKKRPLIYRKLTAADWTPECDLALQNLKNALLSNVVLAHPDFSKPFILSTDASTDGLGAVLSQVSEGSERARPIAFASKTLNRAQSKYPAHRLEFLALKWAVCEKFSHWLKGHVFTAWTDNNPLSHILTKPKLDACEQRWVAKLAAYEFDVKYVPGPKNVVADALSREPFVLKRIGERLISEPYHCLLKESENVSGGEVQEAFRCSNIHQSTQKATQHCGDPDSFVTSAGSFSGAETSAILKCYAEWGTAAQIRSTVLVDHVQSIMCVGQDTLPSMSKEELRHKQREDSDLARTLFYVERRRRPSRRERPNETVETLKLLRHWDKLTVAEGLLYRVSRDIVTKKKRHQYIVPLSLRPEVLTGCHDEAGHQGQDRTLSLLKQRFYWSTMERDVRDYVKHCGRCVMAKTSEPDGRAPLESIKTTAPLELVCIDFWTAEDSKNRPVDVLVVTDHFTRLAHAFQCSDQTAKNVARKLWDNFFCYYGFPERIHSDQGANFESELIAALLQMSGVKKSRTTAYHPMGNGSAERFNRTLGNMIRTLPPRAKQAWPQMLHTLTFMYNSTVHETTGFPPFYLMFGRVPRLPVDVLFKSALREDGEMSFPQYVKELKQDLREAMALAERHANQEQKRQADNYNKRVKGMEIEQGDRVLVANKIERGRHKLADRWGDVVYTVVRSNPKTHTFEIQDPISGQTKVVHRNLLLCVNFLPVLPETNENTSFLSSCASEADLFSEQLPDQSVDHSSRTRHWVTTLSSETSANLSESSVGPAVSCENIRSIDPSNDIEALTNVPVPDSDMTVQTTEDTVVDRNRRLHSDMPYTLTTSRAGRIIRPVNRYTCTMNNQTVNVGRYAKTTWV